MKWVTKDIDTYLQAKEYVDTAVIPLTPISWKDSMKSTVAMGEFITILSGEVERQFKGRIILFPPFTYSVSESKENRLERLSEWSSDVRKEGMEHIIYLSSDSEWKQVEQQVPGSLIWLPTLPLEYVDEKYKQSMIQDQMKQLITIFMNIWQKD
jgi:hypothetical protein